MWESGPRKRDEDGDEEGDVDEDGHNGDGSLGGTPMPPRERGRESPPCASSSMPPRWGEVLPLVLGLHGDDGPLWDPPPWPPVMMAPPPAGCWRGPGLIFCGYRGLRR